MKQSVKTNEQVLIVKMATISDYRLTWLQRFKSEKELSAYKQANNVIIYSKEWEPVYILTD